jgi:hypothetical protein
MESYLPWILSLSPAVHKKHTKLLRLTQMLKRKQLMQSRNKAGTPKRSPSSLYERKKEESPTERSLKSEADSRSASSTCL